MDDDDRRTRPMRSAAAAPPANDPRQPLAAGERIGPWVIGGRLGGGGFGAVYEARHTSGRDAALKILHAHFVAEPEMLARFEREIRVLAGLRHPHVVGFIDAGFAADGRPYLCMERLHGSDLASLLRVRAPFTVGEAYRIFEPLCDALAAAHELGIVHRDLKASNVFACQPDGRIVLLDFGIAKISDALAPELTASHQSLGTPGCMAPEQIRGQRVDGRTDVYALGGLLFTLLTSRPPFEDPSETMTQYLHLHARRPRPSGLVAAPPAIDDVIVRAMAIEPAARFPDVRAVLAAMRDAHRAAAQAAPVTVEHVAIYVAVHDLSEGSQLDEGLLADLEAVLPAAEHALADHGFALALDLGTSALFVARLDTVGDPTRAALAAWAQLASRGSRDARVRAGLGIHRGLATVIGSRVEPCPLLRVETWGLPDPLDGVWVTAAIERATRRLA